MYVNVSGRNKVNGHFSCDIYIDENREDYELRYSDGSVQRQTSPFEVVTADWNNDGDVYGQFGAWFSRSEGRGNEFWTPESMVSELIEAMDPDCRHYGAHIVEIPGIAVPLPDRRLSLNDQIRQSESRALHQDMEKDRKMDALGIKNSVDPRYR